MNGKPGVAYYACDPPANLNAMQARLWRASLYPTPPAQQQARRLGRAKLQAQIVKEIEHLSVADLEAICMVALMLGAEVKVQA